MKTYLSKTVLEAAKERLEQTFNDFEKVYLSFSGGKDSTIMFHLAAEIARKQNKKFGVLIIDLEAQYKLTINHIEDLVNQYQDTIDLYWVALPMSLRNAVSVYEPRWICWDDDKKSEWVRQPHSKSITDTNYFPFFSKGMEFEEFMVEFGIWYSEGKNTAALVGIRADESLNRYRAIKNEKKIKFKNYSWTTKVHENLYNCYPIYDWKTQDIWIYTKKFNKKMNDIYERMRMAGVPLGHMRICQPYGDDQRKGLWLYHLLEPSTWSKVVARVSGVNSGSLYIQDSGNINGYGKISKPDNHTYKSYAELLLSSLPAQTKNHYLKRFIKFKLWWEKRGYENGIPDEAPYELEAERLVPSYRRICKVILRNDWWCKGLSFTQPLSDSFKRFKEMKKI